MNSQFHSYDTWTPLFCLHLLKSFLSKTAEHFLQKQHTVCAAFVDFLNSCSLIGTCFLAFFLFFGFVQPLVTDSEFKPLPPPQPPSYLKKTNKLFWSIRIGLTFQPRKWLKICKCQRTITPPTLKDEVCWQRTRICSCCDFRTFWKLFVHILRKTPVHPYCQPISVLIRSNTDG